MKRIIIIAFIAFFGLSACSKNPDIKPIPTTISPSSMTAKINGVSYSRDSCVFYYKTPDSLSGYIIGIAKGIPDTDPAAYPSVRINFDLGSYHGVGTYSANLNIWADFGVSSTTGETGDSCRVTITSVTPEIVGTFSFITRKGTSVTDGKFTAIKGGF